MQDCADPSDAALRKLRVQGYNCIFPENASLFISREESNPDFAYARTNTLKFLLCT